VGVKLAHLLRGEHHTVPFEDVAKLFDGDLTRVVRVKKSESLFEALGMVTALLSHLGVNRTF
jgi:hypothetical protein